MGSGEFGSAEGPDAMMSETSPRSGSRLSPTVAWSIVTDGPLIGMSLAREAGMVLTCDEAAQLQLISLRGEVKGHSRAPGKILSAAISDDGTLIAVLIEGPRLLLLDGELGPIADRPAPYDSTALGMAPHGGYVALSSRSNETFVYTRHGSPGGSFTTMHPLVHLRFVCDRPRLIGASSFGVIYAFDLEPEGASGLLRFEERWKAQLMSSFGHMAITGDGGIVLVACYTHGVQKYDSRGRNEGSYHLGGTATHAVPDFAGRTIAVATSEGELSVLNGAGQVRWKRGLPRGPIALECDALGRFLVYGMKTGEVTLIDLEGRHVAESATEALRAAGGKGRGGPIRQPAWTVPIAQSDEQAETTVLAVLDEPPRVAVMTNRNRVEVFTVTGEALGELSQITGVGRVLRTAPYWIAGATDRQVMLYDARGNVGNRIDLSLVELSHIAIQPDHYGIALVQERDRIGRVSVAGRWVWKRELRVPVEDIALGPDALTAITTEDGQLIVYDAAGEPGGSFRSNTPEALNLVAAPRSSGAPAELAWITLARHAQALRGHRADGKLLWEEPIPWESWQLHGLEAAVIVEASDGRAIAFDGGGAVIAQTRDEPTPALYALGPDGAPCRIVRQGEHLLCSDLPGRVHWRAIAEEPLGPVTAGREGVATLIGRKLAWFPHRTSGPDDE